MATKSNIKMLTTEGVLKEKKPKSTTLAIPKSIADAIEEHHKQFWKANGYKLNRPQIYVKLMVIGVNELIKETQELKKQK